MWEYEPEPPELNWNPNAILVYHIWNDMYVFYENRTIIPLDDPSYDYISPEIEDFYDYAKDRKVMPFDDLIRVVDCSKPIKKRYYYYSKYKQTVIEDFLN